MNTIKILFVDQDEAERQTFESFVESSGLPYDYKTACSVEQARALIKTGDFDAVISDFHFPDGSALDILEFLSTPPLIVITSTSDQQSAVDAMKKGAYDYMVKDPENKYINALPITVESAIKHKKAEDLFNLLSQAMVSICDCVYITDLNHQIIFVNDSFCTTYGYEREDIIGRLGMALWGEIEMSDDIRSSITNALEEGSRVEIKHKKKDGSTFPVLLSRSIVKDNSGKGQSIVRVSRDITEIKKLEAELRSLTLTDELTGIANRRRFDLFINREWARAIRNKGTISLIMIDIDFFKNFNDTYGHLEGDKCLKAVATNINRTLRRPGDLAVRYGGEEFAVVLSETSKDNAILLAEKLRKDVKGLKIKCSTCKDGFVTISLGVSTMKPEKAQHYTKLIKKADKALYQSKKRGRDRVSFIP